MNRIKWLLYEIKWFFIGVVHVITGRYLLNEKKYGGYELHKEEEGNNVIYDRISSGKPFAFCRYSYTEMDIMIHSCTEQYFKIPTTRVMKWLDIFCMPGESNSKGAARYNALMSEAFKSADMIGIWPNLHMGDALLMKQDTSRDLYVTDARSVEPFFFERPWSHALKGKKVLVVSPFSKAIQSQYKRRELIWGEMNVLPEFTLETEDSIWFYAGQRDERFKNWFEAFDFLFDRIMSHDFDVAILGCGYFGFALSAKIKEAGRQAIHMGGATQLLFGIKGKRWDNNKKINKYFNDYWVRPDEIEKPEDDFNLDNGCYW